MSNPIWSNNHHDDDDDKVVSFSFLGSRWFMITLSVTAGLLGIAILYYLFSSSNNATYDEEVPVMEADGSPHKVRPENPGGFQAPHQDKNIFEVVARDGSPDGEVTVLVPSEEKPLEGKMVFTNEAQRVLPPPSAMVEEIAPVSEEIVAAPVAAVTEEVEIVPMSAGKKHHHKKHHKHEKEDAAEEKEEAHPAAAEKSDEKATLKTKKPAKKSGKFMVQLASMQSKANADDEWKRLQKNHTPLFKGLANRIEKKHVDGKGIFFRLQAGPFDTKEKATAFCAKLKESNIPCFPL